MNEVHRLIQMNIPIVGMKLKAEIETIRTRVYQIAQKVNPFFDDAISFEIRDLFDASVQELTPYKVRLEHLLCKTDKKEQAHL